MQDTIILQNIDALITNLHKENVTDAIISELKTKCSELQIVDLNDSEGYKKVENARLEVKRMRLVAEKICNVFVSEAHSIHKQRTAKRTEIISKFTDIENELAQKQKIIDDQLQKIKYAELEVEKLATQKKVDELLSFGIVKPEIH